MEGAGYKEQSAKTAEYYNNWQIRYNEVYGDTIQAFRPTDREGLLSYIYKSLDVKTGMHILDAGCGVAGPAVWLAQQADVRITGITISEVQAAQARQNVLQHGLQNKIQIITGDYHELSQYVEPGSIDMVMFLESLGHAGSPAKALEQAFCCLKPGGSIYVKDFYYKEPKDEYWKGRIAKTISNINRIYCYNVLGLNETIDTLRGLGFEINYLRKMNFVDDINIRLEFENKFGIDIFDGETEFYPAEWLEIKCLKP